MSVAAPLTLVLNPDRATGFADLIAKIAGRPLPTGVLPWLTPALLFSDSAVQAQLGLPKPAVDQILVQDYQGLELLCPLPLGVPVSASVNRSVKNPTTEFDFSLGHDGVDIATLKTALRCVPRQDLASLKPMVLPDPKALGDRAFIADLNISQRQIDRYVALSGDHNPIHSDPAEAASLGLPAAVVPGLLLLSAIQPDVTAVSPGAALSLLKCRFVAPLCASQAFSIALQSRGPDRLRAYLLGDGARALAIADLQLSPWGASIQRSPEAQQGQPGEDHHEQPKRQ